ncbi:MAG: carboxypeptidase-like regulatory domain-containing protein, partial [Bacteroidota bacterium]
MFLLFFGLTANAGTISGLITDSENNPIPGVTVQLEGTTLGTITNGKGKFEIKSVPAGTYNLQASFIGFKRVTKSITIKGSSAITVDFNLQEEVSELNEVVITGKSESQRIAEQPLQAISIDTRILKAEAVNTVGILTRAPGVRVRQSGGLGSNAEVQLNGLTGNAVRQYYDGIPLELLGGGIQLNNIPVNAIDRIDVYKGVMPIDVGTDALAGGINVVSKEVFSSYLDASYEVGSFNTHVAAVNGAKMLNDHWFVAFNGFFNYSDNNYKMRNIETRILDENGFETFGETQTIERFHNQHQSSFATLQLGGNQLGWVDRIVLSTGFSQRFDEIQHGARVGGRPAGDAETDNQAFFQSIKFEKDFSENLSFNYFGNYAIVKDGINDSTQNLYNWFGKIEPLGSATNGRELVAQPTLREGRTFVTVHRVTGNYKLSENYSLQLSNFYAYQRITGDDPVAQKVPLDNPTTDPNTLPSELNRNILAGQFSANWLNKKVETLLFGKYY